MCICQSGKVSIFSFPSEIFHIMTVMLSIPLYMYLFSFVLCSYWTVYDTFEEANPDYRRLNSQKNDPPRRSPAMTMPGGVDSKGRVWKSETFPAFSMPSSSRRHAAGRVPREPSSSSEKSSTGAKAATRDLSIDDELAQCYPGEVAFDEYSLLVMFKDASGKPLSDATLASLASAQEQIAALSDYQVSPSCFSLR